MKRVVRFFTGTAALPLAFLPSICAAQRTLTVGFGTNLTFNDIAYNIMYFLAFTISILSAGVFMVGAVCLVLGGAQESLKDTGKKLMIGSLIGLCVVLGSYAIARTTFYFVYEQ